MKRWDRKRDGRTGAVVCASLALLLPGCFAQQADLTQVERNLGARIAGLDQQEKELKQAVKQAKADLAQAKADLDRLISEARARLSQEITELREADLPSIRGELDKSTYQVGLLRNRLEDAEQQAAGRVSALEQQAVGRLTKIEKVQSEQFTALKTDRDQLREELEKASARLDATSTLIVSLAKKVDGRLEEHDKAIGGGTSQARLLTEQVSQLNRSLTEFKQALKTLGDRLIQQEERVQELSGTVPQRTEALRAKVESDAQATTAYLDEVKKSVESVAKAVETMGERLMARVDQQDRRLNEVAKAVQAVTTEVAVLSQATARTRGGRGPIGKSPQRGQGGQQGLQEPAPSQVQPDEQAHSSGGSAEDAALMAAPAAAGSATDAAPPAAESGESAKEAYDRILRTFKQGDLDGAQRGFSDFLVQHAGSELAPNAQYWLGECYYGKKDYERAIAAFDRVKQAYPESEKVPAALLKESFAYLALNDRKRALTTLRQVVEAYPKSPEAGKAMDKLAQLKRTR